MAGSPSHSATFVASIAAAMGLGDRVLSPGTSIVAAEARAGSNQAVVYSMGAHIVLWCDPALEAALAHLSSAQRTFTFSELGSDLAGRGWHETGNSAMRLRDHTAVVDDIDSIVVRSLRHDDADDMALMTAFVDSLSDEDRDEADLDDGRLDDHVLVAVDPTGIVAFASQQPFDYAADFGDIAVATRADARGRGLGRLVVERLCAEIVERGMHPLYRHDMANIGSDRLSTSLGFERVIELHAYSPG